MTQSDEVAPLLTRLMRVMVSTAAGMGDHPACERRPWPSQDEQVCGAVLLENTSPDGRAKHVHYCHTDLDAHETVTFHVCVCETSWAENTTGVAELVGPNETIVRPAEEQL